ncbi:MAG: hypothetical protein ACHQD8_02945 [Chitinophagales bacterium]
MSISERRKRKITWILVFLFFGLIVFGGFIKSQNNKAAQKKEITHLPCKTLYKTIPNSDNAIGLIGYELHEDEEYVDGSDTYPTYNVVVKNIDSQADNYKSLCKDIITDVINTCGDEQVVVNIYDSFEAYQLAVTGEQPGKFLSKNEEETINTHRLATYQYTYVDNNGENDKVCLLTYYPDANNGLRENEVYLP